MTLRRTVTLASLALSMFATPAAAIDCHKWKQLGLDQQEAAVYNLIDTTVSGSRGREYQVNRGGIQRCLERNVINIANDFDDTCSNARSAGMQALNKVFKNYVWTCVN
jgi:hypothetical protein